MTARPARRGAGGLGAVALALVVVSAGCAQLRMVTGPKVGDAVAIVAESDFEVTDHRAKDRVRFAVLGDPGTGEEAQRTVARILAERCSNGAGCDFVLVTGDNLYPTGARPLEGRSAAAALAAFDRQFEDAYRALGRTDFWLVAGNHDWYRRGSVQSEIRYSARSDRWRMPALDYPIPRLPPWLAIYAIDTTLLVEGVDTGQVGRAREHLCAAPGWKLVFGHHPVYTPGRRHGGADGTLEEIRSALLDPLLRRCEVDVFAAGHDHLQGHLRTPDFDQVVQGAGGRHLYPVRSSPAFPPGSDVGVLFAESVFGFAILEATRETLVVEFIDASSAGGRIVHRTSLSSE